MTLNHPRSGGGFVPEFQVAPAPWLTQSAIPVSTTTVGYQFTTIARHFRILNHDSGSINVGFSSLGTTGTNKFLVPTSGTLELDCRFTSLFIKGVTGQTYSLFVGLTGIGVEHIAAVTGSNGYNVG